MATSTPIHAAASSFRVARSSAATATSATAIRAGWSLQLTQTLFDWGNYAQLRQADKRRRARRNAVRSPRSRICWSASRRATSTCSRRRTISRQPSRRARAFRDSSSKRSAASKSASSRSRTCSSRKPATTTPSRRRSRRSGLLATSHEFLREIIGEVVTDLASPTDELPLLSPDPANAEQWVQTALRQNLALVSSRLAAEIALDDIEIQRSNRLPTVSLSARLQRDHQRAHVRRSVPRRRADRRLSFDAAAGRPQLVDSTCGSRCSRAG